ncbi:MAG: hypothetical protein Kow006_30240 [Gammaproteobacteria bacterium]
MSPTETLQRFFNAFVHYEEQAIADLFPGPVAIDTPLSGAIDGADALGAALEQEGHWWREHLREIRPLTSLETGHWLVGELEVDLHHEGRHFDLPVALVGQKCPGGLGQIRLYHSTWPLSGRHTYRAPIVWPGHREEEPQVIARYFEALDQGDAGQALELFAPDAYAREPSGSAYRHEGAQELKRFYEKALSDGGIRLTHSTTAFDGRLFAVEFICDGWGSTTFDPMAGCACYELTDDQQFIRAVRIYDDVTPPSE